MYNGFSLENSGKRLRIQSVRQSDAVGIIRYGTVLKAAVGVSKTGFAARIFYLSYDPGHMGMCQFDTVSAIGAAFADFCLATKNRKIKAHEKYKANSENFSRSRIEYG